MADPDVSPEIRRDRQVLESAYPYLYDERYRLAPAAYSLKHWVSAVVRFIGAVIDEWLSGKPTLPVLFLIHIRGEAFPSVRAVIGTVISTAITGLIRKGTRGA